jgi:hypothetical protein
MIFVDPNRLVCVHLRRIDGKVDRLRAIACGYVSIQEDGSNKLALEVLYDPENQEPNAGYVLQDSSHLERLIVPATALVQVHPYSWQ